MCVVYFSSYRFVWCICEWNVEQLKCMCVLSVNILILEGWARMIKNVDYGTTRQVRILLWYTFFFIIRNIISSHHICMLIRIRDVQKFHKYFLYICRKIHFNWVQFRLIKENRQDYLGWFMCINLSQRWKRFKINTTPAHNVHIGNFNFEFLCKNLI